MSAYDHKSFQTTNITSQPAWASPDKLAKAIIAVADKNDDSRISYTDLWIHLYGEKPHYPSFFRKFSRPFAQLGLACVTLKLPYINALVVAKTTRKPSKTAVRNMAEFIKDHGVTTGQDARAYLEEQAKLAAKLSLQDLDKAFTGFKS